MKTLDHDHDWVLTNISYDKDPTNPIVKKYPKVCSQILVIRQTWSRLWVYAEIGAENLRILYLQRGITAIPLVLKQSPIFFNSDGAQMSASWDKHVDLVDCLDNSLTVEQEIFTTGKFRKMAASGGSRQENFANLRLEDLPSFKMSPCLSKLDQ